MHSVYPRNLCASQGRSDFLDEWCNSYLRKWTRHYIALNGMYDGRNSTIDADGLAPSQASPTALVEPKVLTVAPRVMTADNIQFCLPSTFTIGFGRITKMVKDLYLGPSIEGYEPTDIEKQARLTECLDCADGLIESIIGYSARTIVAGVKMADILQDEDFFQKIAGSAQKELDRYCLKVELAELSDFVFEPGSEHLRNAAMSVIELRLATRRIDLSARYKTFWNVKRNIFWEYEDNKNFTERNGYDGDWKTSSRRGRGQRKNEAYIREYNSRPIEDPFDGRECLFADSSGRLRTSASANLDSGLKVPGSLIMSSQYAREVLGREHDISSDFRDPCLKSVSGHVTPVTGILRDIVFRVKGTSVTFKRDFWICDAIDGMADIMIGAKFMWENFKLFFERVKDCASTFATWFSSKKESKGEREERERRERQQALEANRREMARLVCQRRQLEAVEIASQQQRDSNHPL